MNFTGDLIAGGMGPYMSNPHYTKRMSQLGCLGTVSGLASDTLIAWLLQKGDKDALHVLENSPFPEIAERVIKAYYVEGGIPKDQDFKVVPMVTTKPTQLSYDLQICGSYALVALSKKGHDFPVSINFMEKIQRTHLPSIVGAMAAGVDYITMGAGIPTQIPDILENIINNKPISYKVDQYGLGNKKIDMSFIPEKYFGKKLIFSNEPGLIPIISSHTLAEFLLKSSSGKKWIKMFVGETELSGGHKKRPRKSLTLNNDKEPIYGPMDQIDFQKIIDMGVPTYAAGDFATPEARRLIKKLGGAGIQFGTIGEFSDDSGLRRDLKILGRKLGYRGELKVLNNPFVSPTGFVFSIILLEGTLTDDIIFPNRERKCKHGYLSMPIEISPGNIIYLCPAENLQNYNNKGGKLPYAAQTMCLCSGLTANTELYQGKEFPVLTGGKNLSFFRHLMSHEDDSYNNEDVVNYLLSE